MKTPESLFFSLDEFRGRLNALHGRMRERGIDCLVLNTPENIYYISGYQTPGYYFYMALLVPLGREPVLMPPPHEESLVRTFSCVEDYRLFRDTADWADATRQVLESLGMGRATIGLEYGSWFLTARIATELRSLMPSARFVDGTGLVEAGRMIKSSREIEYLRKAAGAAESGMSAALSAVRAGATEAEVAVAAHNGQILAGSEYTGLPMFINSGHRTMNVHVTWTPRVLERGDIVFLEIPGSINRYHAALTRCAFVGNPPDNLLRASEVNRDALRLAKGTIRPGVRACDVFEVARERIDGANIGYKQGRRVAYAMGTAFPPGWDEGHIISLNMNETRELLPGMAFHLITTMRIQGIGAIGCSDTVLVTATGCETLTSGVEQKVHVR